jgi:transposase
MHYAAVKSAEHQARAVALRTHQCYVGQRTQLINPLRGHLAKFGVVVAQGPAHLKSVSELPRIDPIDLPDGVEEIARLCLKQIEVLGVRIDELTLKLREATKVNGEMRKRCTVPGVARDRRSDHGLRAGSADLLQW